jgi:hypothetical protein
MIAWFRGYSISDSLDYSNLAIVSQGGGLEVKLTFSDNPKYPYDSDFWARSEEYIADFDAYSIPGRKAHTWFECAGIVLSEEFGLMSGEDQLTARLTVEVARFPYCSIVLPMTLLSAYLLLSKARPAKKPEPSLPIMGDVADCQ